MKTEICLNCQHWTGKREIDPEFPLRPFNDEWRDGNCSRIEYCLDIEIYAGWNGGSVRRITTPASFGCAAFEAFNQPQTEQER
jgi:hypothetical protein